MASINAQSARFIGNDFIIPTRTKKQIENIQAEPIIAQPISSESIPHLPVTTFVAAVPAKESRLRGVLDFIQLRPKLVTLAVLLVISVFAAPTIARAQVWQATYAKATTLLKAATSNTHRPAAASFTLPAYAKLVTTSSLSNGLSYVELQPNTITMGGITVTPQPADISKWIKSSPGPRAGTTLLSVNIASLSSYITSATKNNFQNGSSNGISNSAISAAVNKIAKVLFLCNGVSVTLPSSANQS